MFEKTPILPNIDECRNKYYHVFDYLQTLCYWFIDNDDDSTYYSQETYKPLNIKG